MGSITFTGELPFELELRQQPTACGADDRINLRLPVCAPGFRQDVLELQLRLSAEQAKQLQVQLSAALNGNG
jgi:hypothetical protein